MPMFDCAFMVDLGLDLENFCRMFSIRTKYGTMVAKAIPVVILAGVYISWPYIRRFWKGGNRVKSIVRSRSVSLSALHGGKLALERLIDYHHARADRSTLDAAEIELNTLLLDEYPDYSELQSIMSKLEMSGKEATTIEILERELEKARKEQQAHEAYEIGMLLTEMYIYKGDFDKALGCECLSHKEISDARRPLYKAILYIMLGKQKEKALKCWEEFVGIRAQFKPASESEHGQLHKVITTFSEFEKVVNLLKADIYEARKTVEK